MRMHGGTGLTARRRGITLGALIPLLVATLAVFPLAAAQADTGNRVDLRVLVLTDGGPSTAAIVTALSREGVPYTTVDLSDPNRAPIDAAFLADAATREGRFQAIVLPDQAGTAAHGLTGTERDTLAAYERGYGVRQVDAYNYPGASLGMDSPAYAGSLDGSQLTVTNAGLTGPFSYLTGALTVDNLDANITEVYGYLAAPSSALPAGETFTPLLTGAAGGATGSMIGVYAHDGREELVVTATCTDSQQWFNEISHGLITWMTRGVHLGYQRNYFAVQVDDVLLADSRWSATGHCTPGDDCTDPNVTTTDIRMTPSDVANLLAWQNTHGFKFDMVFNGGGSDLWKAETDPTTGQPRAIDPTADAFTAAGTENQFTWINHTYSHEFLGCVQTTVPGGTWQCATGADGGTAWVSQAEIESQIQLNADWAVAHHLTNFDKSQLVTGEHSGLAVLPQQPADNPFLASAFAATGVAYTGSDASREAASRLIGSTTTTVPRHPMNIFYNTGAYGDEVSEYNWIYTSAADGGSGLCTTNPATSTCITPLDATTAGAQASFDSYIKPIEVRNALGRVLTHDPRPFFAHQSNLADDGILYPVVQGVLDQYKAVYDTTTSPLVHLDLKGQGQVLSQMDRWASAQSGVNAYIDRSGVHLSGTGGPAVPITVPTGSTVTDGSLSPYAGELSGWITAPATETVVAVPPIPAGGYLTVPAAPTIGTATAGNASATVSWTPPTDTGGAPITGYTVQAFAGTATTAAATLPAAAEATSLTVPGLTNGTGYTFTVAATNAAGTGPASAASNRVTPAAPPAAPTLTARSPAVNATNVAAGSNVTATFSEPVTGLPTTGASTATAAGNLVLRTPTGAVIPAAISYNPTSRVATLNPNANLAADTRYTATLTPAIRDRAGNPLAATSWTFTTGH